MTTESSSAAGQAPVARKGVLGVLGFLFGTWTGRIVLCNSVLFVLLCLQDASLLNPSQETLIAFGAKDTRLLLSGEWWRVFTPMFVHVGLIHFGLNMAALTFIGRQIERIIGPRWFLFIYLGSGLVGGVASALLTLGTSAGASGAIFGLIGVGFLFERLTMRAHARATGQKLRRGPYTGLVVVNILIGLILTSGPIRIDNAAHIGGLVGGVLLTYLMLRWRDNRFFRAERKHSHAVLLLVGVWVFGGTTLACFSDYQLLRLRLGLALSRSQQERFETLRSGVSAFPDKLPFRRDLGATLLIGGETERAIGEFDAIPGVQVYSVLSPLVDELEKVDQLTEAEVLRSYLASRCVQATKGSEFVFSCRD